MRTSASTLIAAGLLAAPLVAAGAAPAGAADPAPTRITLTRWTDNADFRTGTLDGVKVAGGKLVLDRHADLAGSRLHRPVRRRHGAQLRVGTWTSPVVELGTPTTRRSPPGTRHAHRHLGGDPVPRPARRRLLDKVVRHGPLDLRQGLRRRRHPPDLARRPERHRRPDPDRHLQHPHGARAGGLPDPGHAAPPGRHGGPRRPRRGHDHDQRADPRLQRRTSAFTLGRQVELGVPAYAQNIHSGEYPEYGGGGEVWCSPTSTAMVMRSFGPSIPSAAELAGIDAPRATRRSTTPR